jgi:hypothetical protein
VQQARKAVASQYGKPPEAIFLHFLGKELRDGFAMDRLCLGTGKVEISFRNDSLMPMVTERLPQSKPSEHSLTEHTGLPYRFNIRNKDRVQMYYFGTKAIVLDAKRRIAKDLEVPSEDHITFLFTGKVLKNTFILERLPIGDGVITVSISD